MDAFEQFRRSQFISALPPEEQHRLFELASHRSFKRGESIWADGQESGDFVIAQRGWFKLVRSTGVGKEAIVDLREAGSLMCASAPCAGAKYCCASVALEDDAEVTAVPSEALFESFARHPGAAREMVRQIAIRRMEACHRLTQLSNGTVSQRLAALLCELAARAGIVNSHGSTRVPIPLTRGDLAQLCATTTESVIRQMSDLERRGIVQTATRGFVIMDLARLKALAAGEADPQGGESRAASSH